MDNKTRQYTTDAVNLLMRLIATKSISREESEAADIVEEELKRLGFAPQREANNVWATSPDMNERKPTILLNAHIDTVRPVSTWTHDPYMPILDGDVLYGLGANDCGGGLVSLMQAFRHLTQTNQSYNLIYLTSAEEEVSGANGISRVLPLLPSPTIAIVGEPTGMQPAIAERGLMVLDLSAHGKSGHAARGEGVNAIYEMLDDLLWLRTYKFERVSELLGQTMMSTTIISAGTQHNVIPDVCHATVDVRTNELYTNEEVYDIITSHVKSDVKARSFRLHSSHIATDHPLVTRLKVMGKHPFGSPTLSDQALMSFDSLKLGPGESSRSHSADEYVRISEICDAIDTYINLLDSFII